MTARKIAENIFAVGVNDWSRTTFDALFPLPQGTSYNAYVVRGSEKTALIDTVEPSVVDRFQTNLDTLNLERIDYVISNHAEQDHSGAIPHVLARHPEAKVVTNAKCAAFLKQLLHIAEDRLMVVADKATLSLGDKTLQFLLAPWVHWPETMFTLEQETKTLFTCDFLGSHIATGRLFSSAEPRLHEAMKRYYAQIMMPFARNVAKHTQMVKDLGVTLVAPSHGPVHDEPEPAIRDYETWASDRVENEALLLYATMHGSTEKLAFALADELLSRDVNVNVFDLATADIGDVSVALLDAGTLACCTSVMLNGIHPLMANTLRTLNSLKPKTKVVASLSSYGWVAKPAEEVATCLGNLKADFLPPVMIPGHPTPNALANVSELAATIAEKHAAFTA